MIENTSRPHPTVFDLILHIFLLIVAYFVSLSNVSFVFHARFCGSITLVMTFYEVNKVMNFSWFDLCAKGIIFLLLCHLHECTFESRSCNLFTLKRKQCPEKVNGNWYIELMHLLTISVKKANDKKLSKIPFQIGIRAKKRVTIILQINTKLTQH